MSTIRVFDNLKIRIMQLVEAIKKEKLHNIVWKVCLFKYKLSGIIYYTKKNGR